MNYLPARVVLFSAIAINILAVLNWTSVCNYISGFYQYKSPEAFIDRDCRRHAYRVHVFSTGPLVIYISSFITDFEATELTKLK